MMKLLNSIWNYSMIIILTAGVLYFIWAITPWGKRVLRNIPSSDDPSGNDNINRKLHDYM